MSTQSAFQSLVARFDELVEQSAHLSGNARQRARREQKKLLDELVEVAETGMAAYNADYADCRDMRHAWREHFAEWEQNELLRLCICDRCGTERSDAYSRTGALKHRSYNYPNDYIIDGDDNEIAAVGGREPRFWRAVNIQRAING